MFVQENCILLYYTRVPLERIGFVLLLKAVTLNWRVTVLCATLFFGLYALYFYCKDKNVCNFCPQVCISVCYPITGMTGLLPVLASYLCCFSLLFAVVMFFFIICCCEATTGSYIHVFVWTKNLLIVVLISCVQTEPLSCMFLAISSSFSPLFCWYWCLNSCKY